MMVNFKRWALVVSVAFNAATLAGIVYGAWFSKAAASADPGLAAVWKRIEMTPAQRSAYQGSNAKVKQEIMDARDRMHQKWLEGMQLLAAPAVDWTAVRAKEAEISQANRDYNEIFFGVWIDRARLLTAEQRAVLFPQIQEQIKSGKFFNWHPPARSQGGGK
jgi:uncharacterized membrane protein